MKCFYCDREIPSEAKFCPYCQQIVKGIYWEYKLVRDVDINNLERILALECREGWELSRIVPQTITSTQIETSNESERTERQAPIFSFAFNYERFNLLLRRISA